MIAAAVHGVGNPQEVLDEPEGGFFVNRVVFRQNQRDLGHALAVERHPGRAVRLLQRAAGRERGAAVEDADVIQPEKPAGEDVTPLGILAIDPPVEIQHQPVKRLLQESHVRPPERSLRLIELERRPGVHRWIHIAEVPLVGGNLPIGVSIETAQDQQQLVLREIEVHQRQGQRMKRQIPGRVPGIFPFVWHGDHVGVQHVEPLGVTRAMAR